MNTYEALRPLLSLEFHRTKIEACLSESDIAMAERKIGKELPSSFRSWLTTVGDSAYLFRGNLQIHTLLDKEGELSITSNLQFLNESNWNLDPALIIFGDNGQGDMWAFDCEVPINGEYPVIQVGQIFSDEGRKYKLRNSSYARFVYSQALWWTRYLDPNLSQPEDESAEVDWIREINILLDPDIELFHQSVYVEPQTLQEIRADLSRRFSKTNSF